MEKSLWDKKIILIPWKRCGGVRGTNFWNGGLKESSGVLDRDPSRLSGIVSPALEARGTGPIPRSLSRGIM